MNKSRWPTGFYWFQSALAGVVCVVVVAALNWLTGEHVPSSVAVWYAIGHLAAYNSIRD